MKINFNIAYSDVEDRTYQVLAFLIRPQAIRAWIRIYTLALQTDERHHLDVGLFKDGLGVSIFCRVSMDSCSFPDRSTTQNLTPLGSSMSESQEMWIWRELSLQPTNDPLNEKQLILSSERDLSAVQPSLSPHQPPRPPFSTIR